MKSEIKSFIHPKRILICGLGSIGRRHARILHQTFPGVELSVWRSGHGADCPELALMSQCFSDLDAAIAARNQAKARRRSVMVAENALADSDYDSDEEDIAEADANEIMKRFNANKDDSGVADAMSAVKISEEK